MSARLVARWQEPVLGRMTETMFVGSRDDCELELAALCAPVPVRDAYDYGDGMEYEIEEER